MCRHNATFCAITAGDTVPVRIVLGHYGKNWHAEAQGFIGEKWQWLTMYHGEVVPTDNVSPKFVPFYYFSVEKFEKVSFYKKMDAINKEVGFE